jgi:hypothetical protein
MRTSRLEPLVLASLFAALSGLILLGACKGRAPDEHTSLSIQTGKDPGPPSRTLSMVWLHHSTGDEILRGGLRAALAADAIDFHDINYKQAVVDGYVIGDHTDPKDFPRAMNTPKYFDAIRSWERKDGKPHDIVMFKSCFPNSDLKSDAQIEEYKGYYLSMLPTFEKHPKILFISMSTPPLVPEQTTPENAARARRWARWITTEYARGVPNVKIFDLFASLAILEGKPGENTLALQFATSKHDSHPSPDGARAVTRLFIPWLNRAVAEARGAGVL